MSDDEHKQPSRESLLLPIIIPIGVLLVIGVLAVSMGLLLLSMSAEAATLTALMVLIALILVTGLVSRAKKTGAGGLVVMGATFFGAALLVGGVSLATFGQPVEHGEEGDHGGEPAAVVKLAAKDLAFIPTELTAPAEAFTLEFENQDSGIPHNVRIYEADAYEGEPVFTGTVFPGVATEAYEVPALTEGPHAFDCEVHPNMQGTITVAEGGGGGEAKVSTSAKDIAFVETELEVPADTPFSIDFDNQDSGIPHNVRVYAGEAATDEVHFTGEIITGPATITYAVEPLAAGSYLFDCEVHPNMQGTITAKGAEGGPSERKPEKPAGGEEPVVSESPPAEPEAPPEEPAAPEGPAEPGAPAGDALSVVAADLAFDQSELSVEAGKDFTIAFDNQDSAVPHNIEIFDGVATSEPLHFDGEIITGPDTITYEVPALDVGDYLFNCVVHPNMEGTITAT